jgi:F420H(2)-dependent quinone reductase
MTGSPAATERDSDRGRPRAARRRDLNWPTEPLANPRWATILPLEQRHSKDTVSLRRDTSWLARIVMLTSRFANKRGIYIGRRGGRIHVAVYRLSRGRLGSHLPAMPQARTLLLDHTGAKTGLKRRSPVMFYKEGELIAVAASQGGQPSNPARYYNLWANPDTTIQIGRTKRAVRARIATDEERDRLWPKFVAFYPDYEFLQRIAKPRGIPVIVLDPR